MPVVELVILVFHNFNRSDVGLTLETSVFLLFTMANLNFLTQLSTLNYLLYSPTDAAPQFL